MIIPMDIKTANEALNEGCANFGLQQDVEVIEIKRGTRWVLSYEQSKELPDFGRAMIRLERWLKAKLNCEIELVCETMPDRNRRTNKVIEPEQQLRGVESLD